ncbi:toxin Cry1Ac domain D-VI-related protein [Breznakia pachnodae]|uniref:Leucine-rich repeat (LRR) protein/uncharacterized protein YqgV (UPF0045/DUF77 family) n=1 Tax=Breznakia pachnodae TaxID=265178 RepID=A0ABU0E395_9FIRM|nr:toxin Cry1Ac domain D-VI-related protein [Breznakia pachnodae]MDQ0361360.1 Leucine-rich repeat (LRR) protein/uncharacterized protein YqgV (UPF0045/DUF77 family) [Breznakia pachnodae]
MKLKKGKLILSMLVATMLCASLFTGMTQLSADEIEQTENEVETIENEIEEDVIKEEESQEIEETTDEANVETTTNQTVDAVVQTSGITTYALTDPAFPASSQSLHDAILLNYSSIDSDGDNVISIGEANAYTGTISLNNKSITGTLDGIENFINIKRIYLADNQLSGSIPSGIGNLGFMDILHLYNNQLTGSIPESLGNNTSLTQLRLQFNELTGEIPSSLGNLTSLSILYLHENQLSGSIPTTLGNLSSLTYLWLYGNNLTGSIPSELGNLTSLIQLQLNRNDLTGEIPASLGNLSSLTYLSLSMNNLSGEIPVELGNMSSLKTLFLYTNNLTGNIPVELGNVTTLQDIRLYGNQLSGEIPSELGNLTSLLHLRLQYNNLSGSIPSELAGLTSLTTIYLHENNLSGEIPSSISTISTLEELTINDNPNLTGNIANLFNTHPAIKIMIVKGTNTVQDKPTASTLEIYIADILNDDRDNLLDGMTQAQIDEQLTLIDSLIQLKNVEAGSGTIYDVIIEKLRTELVAAQNMVEAKDLVVDLLKPDGTNLNDGVGQAEVDSAQTAVDKLPAGELKDELQKEIDTAQNMLNAIEAVDNLFDADGTIKDTVVQTTIDDAQDLVDLLPSGELKTQLQDKINEAQRQLDEKDAKAKVEDLFTDGSHTNIKDTTDQTAIDNAQDAVDKLPIGTAKDELQKEIDKAQDMLDAKDAVEDLFNEKKDNLADGITQKDIDNAQDLVNKLPNGDLKDQLQKEIDKAQEMLDAKNVVNDLLDKDGNLNSGVTQEDINNAQDLVNKLPDGELKDQLQLIIDEAQKQLDTSVIQNPSVDIPTVVKPSVTPNTSVTNNGTVNTGDMTDTTALWMLLLLSAGYLTIRKLKTR